MQEIPQDLIEKALALCGKMMDDSYDIIYHNDARRYYNDFSYPKFYAYLLSPYFIEKYIENGKGEIYPRNWDDSKWILSSDIGKAIYEYQGGNTKPIIELLSKI